jgi:hypothetical protein
MRPIFAALALAAASVAHADIAAPLRPAGPSDGTSGGAAVHLAADATGYAWATREGAILVQRAGRPPEELAREAAPPRALAAGDGVLGWVSADGRAVHILGAAGVRHSWPADGAYALAVDRAGVVWLESPRGPLGDAALRAAGAEDLRSPLDGRANLGVARTVARDLPMARAVAVDGGEAFVAGRDAIRAVPRAGGAARQLCLAQHGSAVAVEGDSVYFTDEGSDLVARVARWGGSPARLATLHFADAIAVGGGRVFASGGAGDGLLSVRSDGSGASFLTRPHRGELAVGGGALYWLDGRGAIGRTPLR